MTIARDGAGSRPLAVTIAGWGLIADGAISLAVIGITGMLADIDLVPKVVAFILFAAVAALEMWIGTGLLHRSRWMLGFAFPAFFLAIGALIPTPAGEPPPPLYSAIYGWIAMALWVFVCLALIWHRPWFTSSRRG